jgi:undecaprenyl-diphosphatase
MVLVLMFILVAGTLAFIVIAGEVRDGSAEKIDKAILKAFRNPNDVSLPIGPRYMRESLRDLTALGSMTIACLISAIVAGFFLLRRQYGTLLLLTAALGGGQLLSKSLKAYYSRARPEYVNPSHYVDSYSFPSGHAIVAMVLYLTLGALLARFVTTRMQKIYVLGTAVLLAFIVGLTRVYLGVHYPTDVLAGWTVGLLWAIICWLVARALQKRGAVESPSKPGNMES